MREFVGGLLGDNDMDDIDASHRWLHANNCKYDRGELGYMIDPDNNPTCYEFAKNRYDQYIRTCGMESPPFHTHPMGWGVSSTKISPQSETPASYNSFFTPKAPAAPRLWQQAAGWWFLNRSKW